MRVAVDHLLGDGGRHVGEAEGLGFVSDLGMVDDLKQQVAQFLLERRHVIALDGVGDLVGFLDRVRRDRLEGLVDVPGAAVLPVPQPGHDGEEPRGNRFIRERCRPWDDSRSCRSIARYLVIV